MNGLPFFYMAAPFNPNQVQNSQNNTGKESGEKKSKWDCDNVGFNQI